LYLPGKRCIHSGIKFRPKGEPKIVTTLSNITVITQNRFRSLVAQRQFLEGEVVCPIPREAMHSKPTRMTIQIGRNRHVEVGQFSSANHSCNPTLILDTDRMLAFARRDIAPGEELTFFYPSTEWQMQVPFICLCGAANCIHVVAGARFLPLSTLEDHYLNRHIREQMIELLQNTHNHLSRIEITA